MTALAEEVDDDSFIGRHRFFGFQGIFLTCRPVKMRSTILMPNFNNLVRDTACKIDYEKIGKVFSGKHTSEMYDRHAAILDKIARIYADGFVSTRD